MTTKRKAQSSKHKAQNKKRTDRIRVGVDTGGTFTDFVYVNGDIVEIFKVPSTPIDPSAAIRDGLDRISSKLGLLLSSLDVVHDKQSEHAGGST